MNVPGDRRHLEEHDAGQAEEGSCKWGTIRYAISGGWGTTMRLLAVLLVLLGPAYLAYLIFWFAHR